MGTSCSMPETKKQCFYCEQSKRIGGYGDYSDAICNYRNRPQKNPSLPEPRVYQYEEDLLAYYHGDEDHVNFPVYFYYLPDCEGCLKLKRDYAGSDCGDSDTMPTFKKKENI